MAPANGQCGGYVNTQVNQPSASRYDARGEDLVKMGASGPVEQFIGWVLGWQTKVDVKRMALRSSDSFAIRGNREALLVVLLDDLDQMISSESPPRALHGDEKLIDPDPPSRTQFQANLFRLVSEYQA